MVCGPSGKRGRGVLARPTSMLMGASMSRSSDLRPFASGWDRMGLYFPVPLGVRGLPTPTCMRRESARMSACV